MSWEDNIHKTVVGLETVGQFIEKGLQAIVDSNAIHDIVKAYPAAEKYISILGEVIPGIGAAEVALNVADFTAEHWNAIIAIGSIAHFAPADVLTYRPWQEDDGVHGPGDE